jgi:hypothetical protein
MTVRASYAPQDVAFLVAHNLMLGRRSAQACRVDDNRPVLR